MSAAAHDVPPHIAAAMAAIRQEMAAPPADRDTVQADVAGPPDDASAAVEPAGVAAGGAAVSPSAPPPLALPATIDGEVRALLTPLLCDWLDAHLPEIVEAATRAELQRLTGLND